ncbi:putative quinol monooxygenase [Parvibaculum lavamentivorans]|nr:putative quinol monooxygenase [Parvibaculum lavamentivorans]
MIEITNISFVRALPGKTLALGRELCTLIQPTRTEPGCLCFEIHQSHDDADIWFIYESWRSEEDFDAHFETAHMTAFGKAANALVEGELALHHFSRYSAQETLELSVA